MAVTSVKRELVGDPNIAHLVTSNTLAEITTADYWASQQSNVEALNHGAFTFQTGEMVLIEYSGGEGFFTYDSSTDTFVAETDPGSLSETLLNGRVFVGNASNVATGVAMSGDIAITNAGVTSIAAGAIVNADVNASAAIAYSKLAALTNSFILVGNASNVATAVQMQGDATLDNTGSLTIASNAVTSGKVAENLLQYTSVAVSAAEFNGMYVTPKLLVSAGGANTMILVDKMVLYLTYGSVAFANGGAVHAQYDSTTLGAGVKATNTEAAADFFVTASTAFQFEGVTGNTVGALPFSTTVNKGIYLSNATGAFTGGTGTSFIVKIWYKVVPSNA